MMAEAPAMAPAIWLIAFVILFPVAILLVCAALMIVGKSRRATTIAGSLLGAAVIAVFLLVGIYSLRSMSDQQSATVVYETTTPDSRPAAEATEIPIEVAQSVSTVDVTPPPTSRPAWVNQKPGLVGLDYFTVATVGPHATREMCDKDMILEKRRVTNAYIDQLLGEGAAKRVQLPQSYIERQIVKEEWQGPHQSSLGPMVMLHALLKFDKKTQDLIVREDRTALTNERLRQTGAGVGLVLALLGTLFGYLKLDTATKGYYSGRLKLAAAAVILAAAAFSALLA